MVIQDEPERIGFSIVKESDFSSVADEYFTDVTIVLEKLINLVKADKKSKRMSVNFTDETRPSDRKNIFEMYIENGCRLGFYVTRDSWSNNKYAQVIGIDGVTDGEMIEGEPPYFNRVYPEHHPDASKTWQRGITLKADWLDGGISHGSTGGVYTFTRFYPEE